jgi:hypothetical protein
MKRMLILSLFCVMSTATASANKKIVDVSNSDALIGASTFIARLTNLPERKLPLEQEVKEYIAGPLSNEFLLAAYGRMKGMEESKEIANTLSIWGCSSTQSTEPLEMMGHQLGTCKTMVTSSIVDFLERDIKKNIDEQVKKLSQSELDQFYKLRNKEKWKESWLDDQAITKEDEMDIVKFIGLKAYEESIAAKILQAREKNKLVQEAKKHFDIHFDVSLPKVLADEIRAKRSKRK